MANTGRIRYREIDQNPNSPTFNTERWSDWVTDETACPPPTRYNSATISELVQRNDCTGGLTGTFVRYTVEAGAFFSYISQADADAQAQAHFDDTYQAYANANATCQSGSSGITWLPVYTGTCFACLMENSQDPTDRRPSTAAENTQYYTGLPCVACESE
ncbi:hypothetical protein F0P96_10620 [Hymenobacter busanensis]|uniref:DUF5977 domain-containing protein n=1 Tax=Hymenobacter busanensis TaxID=2607656 RepID=A0A7L4ZYI8_9BACT|nr:DUF5977 domain-containing protein [Hymenobacter busanensis]KAA9333414.1 hypothetical protein F0P96_10620 [Hymenobacter busanensis]QHJ07906.1 hypothetical protein GUY19_11685 [Hymenobacter busanensis]